VCSGLCHDSSHGLFFLSFILSRSNLVPDDTPTTRRFDRQEIAAILLCRNQDLLDRTTWSSDKNQLFVHLFYAYVSCMRGERRGVIERNLQYYGFEGQAGAINLEEDIDMALQRLHSLMIKESMLDQVLEWLSSGGSNFEQFITLIIGFMK